MIHNLIATAPSIWPRIGLIFFLAFFTVILVWALRGKASRFERLRNLPLEDDAPSLAADSGLKGVHHE